MFTFVVFTFGICWLPYHVYFIYSYHNPQVGNHFVLPQIFYLADLFICSSYHIEETAIRGFFLSVRSFQIWPNFPTISYWKLNEVHLLRMYLISRWKQNKVQLKIQKLVKKDMITARRSDGVWAELVRPMATARRTRSALRTAGMTRSYENF